MCDVQGSRLKTLGRQASAGGYRLLHVLRLLNRPFLLYHRVLFRLKVGYWPHFRNPRTFNEKICWMKFNYKDPRLPKLMDKLAVREYVARVAPELRTPEVYFVATSADDIPFDALPERCVIKSSHGSHQVIFYDRKSTDREFVRSQCRRWLSRPHRPDLGEWPYLRIPRRVFAEQLMLDQSGELPQDYKFFVFNSRSEYILVVQDRHTTVTRTYYDAGWHVLPMRRGNVPRGLGSPPPVRLQDMLRLAERLADGFPFVRVDLYEIDGDLYFGELTFFPVSGLGKFEPQDFDLSFGEQLDLTHWMNRSDMGATDD